MPGREGDSATIKAVGIWLPIDQSSQSMPAPVRNIDRPVLAKRLNATRFTNFNSRGIKVTLWRTFINGEAS